MTAITTNFHFPQNEIPRCRNSALNAAAIVLSAQFQVISAPHVSTPFSMAPHMISAGMPFIVDKCNPVAIYLGAAAGMAITSFTGSSVIGALGAALSGGALAMYGSLAPTRVRQVTLIEAGAT